MSLKSSLHKDGFVKNVMYRIPCQFIRNRLESDENIEHKCSSKNIASTGMSNTALEHLSIPASLLLQKRDEKAL